MQEVTKKKIHCGPLGTAHHSLRTFTAAELGDKQWQWKQCIADTM